MAAVLPAVLIPTVFHFAAKGFVRTSWQFKPHIRIAIDVGSPVTGGWFFRIEKSS